MSTKSLVEVLMERDGMSKEAAEVLIAETREEVFASFEDEDGRDPEEIIASNLGLEPDYIFDLI